MALTYFAQDGSYGDAAGLVIIDTRAWNRDQWQEVDNALNDERVGVAVYIAAENGDI